MLAITSENERTECEAFEALWQRYISKLGEPTSASTALLLIHIIIAENPHLCTFAEQWQADHASERNADFINRLFEDSDECFFELTRMTKSCFANVLSRIESHDGFEGEVSLSAFYLLLHAWRWKGSRSRLTDRHLFARGAAFGIEKSWQSHHPSN